MCFELLLCVCIQNVFFIVLFFKDLLFVKLNCFDEDKEFNEFFFGCLLIIIQIGDDIKLKFMIVNNVVVIINNVIDFDIGDVIYIFVIVGVDSLICDLCKIGMMMIKVNIEFVNEFIFVIYD